jgi:competence CoiA-like predicted nuclease
VVIEVLKILTDIKTRNSSLMRKFNTPFNKILKFKSSKEPTERFRRTFIISRTHNSKKFGKCPTQKRLKSMVIRMNYQEFDMTATELWIELWTFKWQGSVHKTQRILIRDESDFGTRSFFLGLDSRGEQHGRS